MEKQDDLLEKLMRKIGDFGRYQCFQFLLQVVSTIPTGLHMVSLVTVAGVPDHRCAVNEIDDLSHARSWNSSSIMTAIPTDMNGKFDSCHLYGENMTLVECQSWVYDTQYYTSSRGIEWDFVCSRRWMRATAQCVFMCGVIVGSFVLGPLSDRFGRKTVFLWSSIFQLFSTLAVTFAPDYYSFVVLQFVCGIFAITPYKAGYVLFIELIGPSKRTICATLFQVLFGVGVMLVGVWGYLIDNRFYLQIVYALHSTLLLPHWFLLDESPRWLWSKGRIQESVAIVEKALKMNRSIETLEVPLMFSSYENIREQQSKDSSAGIFDLFKTPNMLRKTLILSGCWFADAVVYYGLTLNTGRLNGNPHMMMFISGLVELPGYTITMCLVNRVGHRSLLSGTMLLSGLSLLTVVFLPYGSSASTTLVMIGKLIISGSYAVIFKYASELFPTVVRSSGVGFGTMCSSVAAALTPLITLLDYLDPTIPTSVFGVLVIFFGTCSLFLPETLGRRLPQTIADGEYYGIGDTCFTNCKGRRLSEVSLDSSDFKEPLDVLEKK